MKILHFLMNLEVTSLLNELSIGLHGVAEKIRTNIEKGLTPNDFEERDNHFGSNYKEPQKRTP